MAGKLIWGILGGLLVGAAFGAITGDTGIAIAVCIGVGVVAAGGWHYFRRR